MYMKYPRYEIHRDRTWVGGFQNLGGGGHGELLLNEYGVFFWGDGSILEPGRGGGCAIL